MIRSTLSPAGKCFSYDIKASGFGRGEGAACIIIKRLSEALACGDPVRAIIRNTVCNHAGRTQGISMPSRASQEKLLTRLHRDIGVQPSETTFVEVRQAISLPRIMRRFVIDVCRLHEHQAQLWYRAMELGHWLGK